MGPQRADTDTQSMSKIKIRTTMPENTHVRVVMEAAEISPVSGLHTTSSNHGTQSGSSTNKQWRVLLVDDNAAVRTVLKGLLEEHADIQVVAEASDGQEAVVLAERYRPDVTIMDIRLPQVSGVEATRQIKRNCLKAPSSECLRCTPPTALMR